MNWTEHRAPTVHREAVVCFQLLTTRGAPAKSGRQNQSEAQVWLMLTRFPLRVLKIPVTSHPPSACWTIELEFDNYVYECVRHFLLRRHKVQSRGTTRFSIEAVFGELGVLQLRRIQMGPRS